MVNIRKFDVDEALDQILMIFWQKGYDHTSLDDIVRVTGVKRQSLYNAFGNKDQMFITVYERYLHRTKKVLAKAREEARHDLHMALQNMLKTLTDEIINPETPAGCFIANSANEFSGKPEHPIYPKIQRYYQEIEDMLYLAFVTAKEAGTLKADRDPRALAQYIIAGIVSLAIMYRINQDLDYLNNVMREVLLSIR